MTGVALTSREVLVIHGLAMGWTYRRIGTMFGTTAWVVSDIVQELRVKLGARSRAQVVSAAIRLGLVAPPKGRLYPDATARELEVLRAVAAGYTDQQIADGLGVSIATVSRHVQQLLRKAQAVNRAQLVARTAGAGWIDTTNVPAGDTAARTSE